MRNFSKYNSTAGLNVTLELENLDSSEAELEENAIIDATISGLPVKNVNKLNYIQDALNLRTWENV